MAIADNQTASVADKLAEARALIERGWCQDVYARDRAGNEMRWADRRATCYCTRGALYAVGVHDVAYEFVFQAVENQSLAIWNDAPERTQAEVIDAFKRAEQLAREAGQ